MPYESIKLVNHSQLSVGDWVFSANSTSHNNKKGGRQNV